MKRLMVLLMVCAPIFTYADESRFSLKHIWKWDSRIGYSGRTGIAAAPAKEGTPAMLADTFSTSREYCVAIGVLEKTGLGEVLVDTDAVAYASRAYGDINHDGNPEFVFLGSLYKAQQEAFMAIRLVDHALDKTFYPISGHFDHRGLAVGDMDGDGKNEIVYYRVDKAAEEYWEGSLVMARIEGGEVMILDELPGLPLVDDVVIADFDGDAKQEVVVVEGRVVQKPGRQEKMEAPFLVSYFWTDGHWNKEPKAVVALDPEMNTLHPLYDTLPSPCLAVWNDNGKRKVLAVSNKDVYAYEMADGKWSSPEIVIAEGSQALTCIGAIDFKGQGKESILAWVMIPKENPEGPLDRYQHVMYAYQREN